MRKILAGLLLLCAVPLTIAAQENDLKIPSEVAPFVEPETKAIALEAADLNGDGAQDFVLVLEHLQDKSADEQGQRSLLILTRGADGKLTLAKRNEKGVVFCRTCGGVFGDPFAGVVVATKTLTINLYGGSAWRWTFSYKFNYSRIDRTWQLVRAEEGSFHAPDAEHVKTKTYMPPKDFGKIDIADFDPENFLKTAKPATKKNAHTINRAFNNLNAHGNSNNFYDDDEPLCRVKDSTAGFANVRQSPNLNGTIITQLKSGTLAYPGDSSTDERGVVWIKVRRSRRAKFIGWVSIVNLECAG